MPMIKWPKEWIEALRDELRVESAEPEIIYGDILAALHEIGALKDPPKPRRIRVCSLCSMVTRFPGECVKCSELQLKCNHDWVEYLEVLDD